jgi:DNA-binding LytR/AlgR family response regulator
VMPGGISGRDVAALARKLKRPGIKILLTSGYAEDLVPVDPELAQLKILRKPYRQGDLVSALREVFASSAVN